MGEPFEDPDDEQFQAQARWTFALARELAGSEDEAREIAQDAWLAWLRKRPLVPLRAKSWWRSVCANLRHASRRRRDRQERVRRRPQERSAGTSPDKALLDAETARRLARLVSELDASEREVLVLRYVEDLDATQIGVRLGIPASTVRGRLMRGLEGIRATLRREDGPAWRTLLLPLTALPIAGRGARRAWLRSPGMLVPAAVFLLAAVLVPLLARPSGSAAGDRATVAAAPAGTPALAAAAPQAATIAASEFPRRVGLIAGTVLDAAGRPAADALVVVASHEIERPVPAADGLASGPARSTRTDALGHFEIEPAPGPFHVLLVDAAGHAPWVREAVGPGTVHEARLRNGSPLLVRIVDAGGRDVAAAGARWTGIFAGIVVRRRAEASPAGGFVLSGLPEGAIDGLASPSSQVLDVSAPGCAPVRRRLTTPGTGAARETTVRLGRGCLVRGRVVDAHRGAPLASAGTQVWMEGIAASVPGPDGRRLPDPEAPWRLAGPPTDEHGRFTIANVPFRDPEGEADGSAVGSAPVVWVGAVADGHAPWFEPLVLNGEGATSEVEVRCPDAAVLTGRIRLADGSGAPDLEVAFAPRIPDTLALPPEFEPLRRRARTDGDGCFRVERGFASPEGRQTLTLRSQRILFKEDAGQVVRLQARQTTENAVPPLTLGPLRRLEVAVADLGGNPLPGAAIWVSDGTSDPALAEGADPVFSDAAGRAVFQVATNRRTCRIHARAPGHLPAEPVDAELEDDGVLRAEVALEPCSSGNSPSAAEKRRDAPSLAAEDAATVTVVLREASGGLCLPDIQVALTRARLPEGPEVRRLGIGEMPYRAEEVRLGVSAGSNSFRIGGVPAGDYQVQILSREHAAPPVRVSVPAGCGVVPVTIDLVAAARLSGRVVAGDGTPLARGKLQLTPWSGIPIFSEIGEEGRFEAPSLDPGTDYRVSVLLDEDDAERSICFVPAEERQRVLRPLGGGSEPIEIVLARATRTRIELSRELQERLAAQRRAGGELAEVEVRDALGALLWREPAAFGAFLAVGLPPGRHVLAVRGTAPEIRKDLVVRPTGVNLLAIDDP